MAKKQRKTTKKETPEQRGHRVRDKIRLILEEEVKEDSEMDYLTYAEEILQELIELVVIRKEELEEEERECPDCWGGGECQDCGGEGHDDEGINCENCNGNGNCPVCGGSGEI